jgi:DNA modification methylase
MTDRLTIICGDALAELRRLADESVQCCVTSPPFYGLRDYGCAGQLGLEKTPAEYVAKWTVTDENSLRDWLQANAPDVFEQFRQESRNKNDLWTVAPANFPEAHFATYPPDLIKPCVLAGTRVGDTVLDPFAGSGTTGQVAIELGRKALLIELNPKYIPLIENRCDVTPGLQLA